MHLTKNTSANDTLWPQLRALPAFRALIRAMEARLFIELGPLPRPMLDIGCGDGHFAEALGNEIDVGLDLDQSSLHEAQERGIYRSLVFSSATCMPFPDNNFASVISNCVIEHIPDNNSVMSEVYRVLQPGGRFIFSVPTNRLNDELTITKLLSGFGQTELAGHYKDWFTSMQVHFHMYAPEEWQRRAEAVGFKIIKRTGYMSPRATALFDLGHFYGVPNLINRKLTGNWVLFPWRPLFTLEERLLAPLVAEDDPPGATCCFFVAEK